MNKRGIDPWLTVAGVCYALNLLGWLAYFIWRIWSGRA